MKRAPSALASILLLASCAGALQWVKPDASAEQLAQDTRECRQQAWVEANSRAYAYRYYGDLGAYYYPDPFGYHYFASPFAAYPSPWGNYFIEESRLADFCMRAKGYRLVEATK